jgi:Tfp pilus assembly protein PilE
MPKQGTNSFVMLMELMIAVAIVSIQAGIAFLPCLQRQIAKGRRAERSGIHVHAATGAVLLTVQCLLRFHTIQACDRQVEIFFGRLYNEFFARLRGVACTPASATINVLNSKQNQS